MSNLLYYPTINLPESDWTIRTLLYYDTIGCIVTQQVIENPEEKFNNYMLNLVRNDLIQLIDPLQQLENPYGIVQPFLDMIKSNTRILMELQHSFEQAQTGLILADKFHGSLAIGLINLGLASESNGHSFVVERRTANFLMQYLAGLLSKQTGMLAVTDTIRNTYFKQSFSPDLERRKIVLEEIIPSPSEISIDELADFKREYSKELRMFRLAVEELVLNRSINQESQFFKVKLKQLAELKSDLSDKMEKVGSKKLIFRNVVGLVTGGVDILNTANSGGINIIKAIGLGLQMQSPTKVLDQSGMKYLALVDMKLRRFK